MNKIQTLLTTTVLLFGISGSGVADFNDGYDAYQKGDYKTAFNEFKPLAEQGDASAQYNLGVMYDNGKGVLKDDKEAVKWYRKAAEQGLASAQGNLGAMYANGHGVLKDLSKAKHWIKKAYDNPDAETSTVELAEKNWNKLELWKH
jgi:TPR repeat protein